MGPMPTFEISWEAPEFEYREKSLGWYWLSMLAAAAVLGFAIFEKNFLFGVFVIIAEILVLVWANRAPDTVVFTLTDKGLAAGETTFYALGDIERFGIADSGKTWSVFVLSLKRPIRPAARVNVPNEKVPAVRNALRSAIPEEEIKESLTDALEKFLKF